MRKLLRRYRRYRRDNQYNSSFTIFFAKSVIPLCILAGTFIIAKKFVTSAPLVLNTKAASSTVAATENTPVKLTSHNNKDKEKTLANNELLADVQTQATQADVALDLEKKTKQIVGRSWLIDLDPNRFIIQLASSPDRDLLLEFANELDTSEPIAIYEYRKKQSGNPIFGLASGVYADLDAGLTQVELLPEVNRRFDPWVRPVQDVQQGLTNAAFPTDNLTHDD